MKVQILIFGVLFCCLFSLQTAYAKEAYKKFDQEEYEKAIDGVDYTEDFEEIEFREPKVPNINLGNWALMGDLLKGIAILAVVLVLAYLIFLIFDENYGNRKVIDVKDIHILKNLEQHIHDVDLTDLLKKAIHDGDYKLAVRIHYLILIKTLSNQNLIAWKKQKTNGEYLSELYGKPLFEDFRISTNLFERIWYGEVEVNANRYASIQVKYDLLLSKISKGGPNEA